MMMRISFTGTRDGMSQKQADEVRAWLFSHRRRVFSASHGCCCGADVEFHAILREIFGKTIYIAVFPSDAGTAAPVPADANYVHVKLPPLVRDVLIVQAGRDQLLATPKQVREVVRSGTWATVRYAKKLGVPCEVFLRR